MLLVQCVCISKNAAKPNQGEIILCVAFANNPSLFFYAGNNVVNAGASNSANANYEIKACVRWLKSGSSNMAVLEFNLLTGMEADRESLEGVSTESNFCFGKLVLLKPSS